MYIIINIQGQKGYRPLQNVRKRELITNQAGGNYVTSALQKSCYSLIAKYARDKVKILNLYMISMTFESTKAKRFVVVLFNFAFLFEGFLIIQYRRETLVHLPAGISRKIRGDYPRADASLDAGGRVLPRPRTNSAGEYRYSVCSSPRLKFVYFTPKAIDRTLLAMISVTTASYVLRCYATRFSLNWQHYVNKLGHFILHKPYFFC